jgi:hypothetical protein
MSQKRVAGAVQTALKIDKRKSVWAMSLNELRVYHIRHSLESDQRNCYMLLCGSAAIYRPNVHPPPLSAVSRGICAVYYQLSIAMRQQSGYNPGRKVYTAEAAEKAAVELPYRNSHNRFLTQTTRFTFPLPEPTTILTLTPVKENHMVLKTQKLTVRVPGC